MRMNSRGARSNNDNGGGAGICWVPSSTISIESGIILLGDAVMISSFDE